MLYGLYFLLTNLHISFYHQSDVSLHQGTTFAKLLLSPEIRNAVEKVCKGTSELRSTRPNLVLTLTTPYLWIGLGCQGADGCVEA